MAVFEVTTFVARPQEEVFAYMSDPANFPQWQNGTKEAYWSSDGPVGVGSTFDSVGQLLGRKMSSTLEITQWDLPYAYGVKGSAGPMTFGGIMTFEAQEGGTLIRQNFEGEMGGFLNIAEGMAVKQLQKQIEADGQTLKSRLEAS